MKVVQTVMQPVQVIQYLCINTLKPQWLSKVALHYVVLAGLG